ncbi:hypothetical protein CR513_34938, partial [Mucuna pruriens]
MSITKNQAVSSFRSEEGALQRLMPALASLQQRSEEQARMIEETKKRQEEAERCHEEELKLSSVIIQEGEGKQRPIYYVSKALQGAE